jgi:hypothetical protein
MLNDSYNYAAAINAKGQPFPAEPLIMALLLSQHKVINRITELFQSRNQITKKLSSPNNKKKN